jgi:hypothetical protein
MNLVADPSILFYGLPLKELPVGMPAMHINQQASAKIF